MLHLWYISEEKHFWLNDKFWHLMFWCTNFHGRGQKSAYVIKCSVVNYTIFHGRNRRTYSNVSVKISRFFVFFVNRLNLMGTIRMCHYVMGNISTFHLPNKYIKITYVTYHTYYCSLSILRLYWPLIRTGNHSSGRLKGRCNYKWWGRSVLVFV